MTGDLSNIVTLADVMFLLKRMLKPELTATARLSQNRSLFVEIYRDDLFVYGHVFDWPNERVSMAPFEKFLKGGESNG